MASITCTCFPLLLELLWTPWWTPSRCCKMCFATWKWLFQKYVSLFFYIFFHWILFIEGLNVTWLKVFLTHIVFYLGVRAGCLIYNIHCRWNNQGKIIVLSKGSLGFLGWGPGYGGPAKWESFESLGLGRCRLLLASVLLVILFRISDSSLRSWSSDGNSRLLFLDFL